MYTLFQLLIIPFIIFFLYLMMKKKEVMHGYQTIGSSHPRGIEKEYSNGPSVQIFHWGSHDFAADGNDSYLGIFGLITSSNPNIMDTLDSLFDSVEKSENRDNLYTVKKNKVFFDTPEFNSLISKLDATLRVL